MILTHAETAMQSFSSLIRAAASDNPLARAIEAILDSGLIIVSRDTRGRLVQLSEVLSERVGLIAPAGASQPPNTRVFNRDGRLLPGSEYAASITRTTGVAQRDALTRVVSADDRHIWLQLSTMPLERGPEGWSVLSVAADVTDIVDSLDDARREVAARGALIELAAELAGRPLPRATVLERVSEALSTIVPGANVFLNEHHGGDTFRTEPLLHGYGNPAVGRSGRFTPDLRQRYTADRAHINLAVEDTDIYDSAVVAELQNPFGSIVVSPFGITRQGHIGAIAVMGEPKDAFSPAQIETFEHLGRIVADALAPEEEIARGA